MNCPICKAAYRIQGEEGVFARNVCACEVSSKTCRTKRCKDRVVQAELEADGATVSGYLCRNHCNEDVLDESVPAPVPPPMIPPPPADPHSREGMIIEEAAYVTSKKAAQEEIKAQKFKVQCTEYKCGYVHPYSMRKLAGEGKAWTIVCPKCGGTSYRCLE